jgi:hypothetical protein
MTPPDPTFATPGPYSCYGFAPSLTLDLTFNNAI